MEHRHFKKISSTQSYLKENLSLLWKSHKNILISTDYQEEGQGRRGRVWDSYYGSLAFSLTLLPSDPVSLTPLEVGLLIKKFMYEKYQALMQLKWPNDLMTSENKKCGGILCSYQNKDMIIVGVGINLMEDENLINSNYPTAATSLFQKRMKINSSDLCQEIYCYILAHRMNRIDILMEWNDACSHLNQKIQIQDSGGVVKGIFRGISELGLALVDVEGAIVKVASGDLSY